MASWQTGNHPRLWSLGEAVAHSSWWLAFTGFVGVAMVWFAATGFYIMANGLYWLGAEPRLVPEKAIGPTSPHVVAREPAR